MKYKISISLIFYILEGSLRGASLKNLNHFIKIVDDIFGFHSINITSIAYFQVLIIILLNYS